MAGNRLDLNKTKLKVFGLYLVKRPGLGLGLGCHRITT